MLKLLSIPLAMICLPVFAFEEEKYPSLPQQTRVTIITATTEQQFLCESVEYVFSHNPNHTGRGVADGCSPVYSVALPYQAQVGDGVVFRVGASWYADCHFNEIANVPPRITLVCADSN